MPKTTVTDSTTMMLLDPPRTGADVIVDRLKLRGLKRIVYVSCHPASFIRDVRILVNQGWALVSVEPFDLFPSTGHGEVLGILNRS